MADWPRGSIGTWQHTVVVRGKHYVVFIPIKVLSLYKDKVLVGYESHGVMCEVWTARRYLCKDTLSQLGVIGGVLYPTVSDNKRDR